MSVLELTEFDEDVNGEDGFGIEIEDEIKKLSELELPSDDGIPMESNWHRIEMNLLIDSVHYHWRDRSDYFAGGNMFIYFSLEQVRRKHYRGPDFFLVKDVDGTIDRESWVIWDENGRYPDVIVELSSKSSIKRDLGFKKELYAHTFHTSNYFCYNPLNLQLLGWHLAQGSYIDLQPNDRGWLWCDELKLWLGIWEGEYLRVKAKWLRFYTADGELVPSLAEAGVQRAIIEAKRAEAEAQRAKLAEAKIAHLRALLEKHGIVSEE